MSANDKRPGDGSGPAQLRIRLKYADVRAFIERYGANVSRTGMFLASRTPKSVGTSVRFELLLSDGRTRVLKGDGVVAYVREYDPSAPTRPHGMGIKFTRLDGESLLVIEQIEAAKRDRGREHDGHVSEGPNGEWSDDRERAERTDQATADTRGSPDSVRMVTRAGTAGVLPTQDTAAPSAHGHAGPDVSAAVQTTDMTPSASPTIGSTEDSTIGRSQDAELDALLVGGASDGVLQRARAVARGLWRSGAADVPELAALLEEPVDQGAGRSGLGAAEHHRSEDAVRGVGGPARARVSLPAVVAEGAATSGTAAGGSSRSATSSRGTRAPMLGAIARGTSRGGATDGAGTSAVDPAESPALAPTSTPPAAASSPAASRTAISALAAPGSAPALTEPPPGTERRTSARDTRNPSATRGAAPHRPPALPHEWPAEPPAPDTTDREFAGPAAWTTAPPPAEDSHDGWGEPPDGEATPPSPAVEADLATVPVPHLSLTPSAAGADALGPATAVNRGDFRGSTSSPPIALQLADRARTLPDPGAAQHPAGAPPERAAAVPPPVPLEARRERSAPVPAPRERSAPVPARPGQRPSRLPGLPPTPPPERAATGPDGSSVPVDLSDDLLEDVLVDVEPLPPPPSTLAPARSAAFDFDEPTLPPPIPADAATATRARDGLGDDAATSGFSADVLDAALDAALALDGDFAGPPAESTAVERDPSDTTSEGPPRRFDKRFDK